MLELALTHVQLEDLNLPTYDRPIAMAVAPIEACQGKGAAQGPRGMHRNGSFQMVMGEGEGGNKGKRRSTGFVGDIQKCREV